MNIIFHADDFGITEDQSRQILDCADRGVLNSLSVMPNSERAEACVRLLAGRDLCVSAHLNLTEGKPVLPAERVPLLVDEKGYFCLSFAKLFLKSLAGENSDFAKQVRDELTAQVHRVRGLFPEGTVVNLDSHQHIHMIPLLFRMTLGLAENTPGVRIRLTSEPVGPFLKKPRFYRTYRLINWVKVFLLKTFAASNRKRLKKRGMDAPVFFGVLMTGHMDLERVSALLGDFVRIAEKQGRDLEVLFHPGRVAEASECLNPNNAELVNAQLSENHEKEHDALVGLKNML